MRTLLCAVCALAASTSAVPSAVHAGTEPSGIYFNRFTGSFNGTEWFQVMPTAVANQYLMVDIFGGGFTTTVNAQGQVFFTNGSGSFSDSDNFVLFPFGGSFTFDCNRVPFTDDGFPLGLDGPPQSGDSILAAEYNSLTRFYDPETGALQGGGSEVVDITVNGTTLRITDPNGLFFQGVFTGDDTVAFRAVTGGSGIFASFPGSSQNVGQNMLGELKFSDVNNFTATILLQTMAPLGAQQQTLVRFEAERVDPIPTGIPGDLDGDGDVDVVDLLDLIVGWGPCPEPCPPACAGDLDDDCTVGVTDLVELLLNWG